MNGKGDKPRPVTDRRQYESNWDRVFRKPDKAARDRFGKLTITGRVTDWKIPHDGDDDDSE